MGDGARTSEQGAVAVAVFFSFAFQQRAHTTDEGVLGRRHVGGWEGCAGVAREFADTTKRRQNRFFERRGTADLIAKSLNNYPVNILHACKRRARRAHAQASGTHQTTKLSNGKLKRRRRGATPEALVSKHRSAAPTPTRILILAPSTPNAGREPQC